MMYNKTRSCYSELICTQKPIFWIFHILKINRIM